MAETEQPAEAGDPVAAQGPVAHLVHRDGRNGQRRVGRRGLQVVEELAAGGLCDSTIATRLRMHRGTFRDVRARQPEVEEALQRGRGLLEDELCHLLLSKARKGDTIAAIFLAKARCGWREGELPPGTTVVNNHVQMVNLPALTPAQFDELLSRADPGGGG
jgi:hypothetical protein